jgi:hypothetical protein
VFCYIDDSSNILRPRQTEVEGSHDEYAVYFISDVKINNWLRRKGPYLKLLTHFLYFDILEWILVEQVDE